MRIRVRIKSDDQGEDEVRIKVMKVRTRVDREDRVREGEVHIGQHQGHVGTNVKVELEGHVRVDIKAMLGQDEGRSK